MAYVHVNMSDRDNMIEYMHHSMICEPYFLCEDIYSAAAKSNI